MKPLARPGNTFVRYTERFRHYLDYICRVAACRSKTRYDLKYELLLHISVTVIHESSSWCLIVECPRPETSCLVCLVPGSTHFHVLRCHIYGHCSTCMSHRCHLSTSASSSFRHLGTILPHLQFRVPTHWTSVLLLADCWLQIEYETPCFWTCEDAHGCTGPLIMQMCRRSQPETGKRRGTPLPQLMEKASK